MGLSPQDLHGPHIRCENTSQESGPPQVPDKCSFFIHFTLWRNFSCFLFSFAWTKKGIFVTLLPICSALWDLGTYLDDMLDWPPFCPRYFRLHTRRITQHPPPHPAAQSQSDWPAQDKTIPAACTCWRRSVARFPMLSAAFLLCSPV